VIILGQFQYGGLGDRNPDAIRRGGHRVRFRQDENNSRGEDFQLHGPAVESEEVSADSNALVATTVCR